MANLSLERDDTVRFTVRGRCMPILADGASVRVRRQRLYLSGDVVVVRRAGHWNAHRFLGYAPSTHGVVALTQADDATEADPAAPVSAIVGRAQCEVRASDRMAAMWRYAHALIRRLGRGRR